MLSQALQANTGGAAHANHQEDSGNLRVGASADIVVLDDRFAKYKLGNTPIQRLHTGTLWAEGPAWNGVGR